MARQKNTTNMDINTVDHIKYKAFCKARGTTMIKLFPQLLEAYKRMTELPARKPVATGSACDAKTVGQENVCGGCGLRWDLNDAPLENCGNRTINRAELVQKLRSLADDYE